MRYLLAIFVAFTLALPAQATVNLTLSEEEHARFMRYLTYEVSMMSPVTKRNYSWAKKLGWDGLASKIIFGAIKSRQEQGKPTLRYRKERNKQEYVDRFRSANEYEQARDGILQEAYQQAGV